jgi:SAM-dependent methyltransferase
MGLACPVCRQPGDLFRAAADVARDLRETTAGYRGEADYGPLQMMQGDAVDINGCDGCGTLWRAAPAQWASATQRYAAEHYDPSVVERVHLTELEIHRSDSSWLARQGVVPGAHLLEVGCYVGAFLRYAGDRGADIVGIDPNAELVAACRSRGLEARVGTLDVLDLPRRTCDGVWILSCFEQLGDPDAVLASAHRCLGPEGRLVIRTPSAWFVRAAYGRGGRQAAAARRQVLWGLPHLCCYTPPALAALVERHGFTVETMRERPSGAPRSVVRRAGAPWFDLVARAGPRAVPDEAEQAVV